MGGALLQALGYCYVRQVQKVRGRQATGTRRLGGLYESALVGA